MLSQRPKVRREPNRSQSVLMFMHQHLTSPPTRITPETHGGGSCFIALSATELQITETIPYLLSPRKLALRSCCCQPQMQPLA